MIMQEVALELQAIKESRKAQKTSFRVEMKVVREQLRQIEVKSAELEKEIGLFKAKEQTWGQHLGKDAPAIKKNQVQPKGQRKSLEKLAEPIEEE